MQIPTLLTALIATAIPQDQGFEEVVLTFAWPETGSVRVEARSEIEGNIGETAFVLHWAPDREGRGIVVDHTDYELVRSGDKDASHPSLEWDSKMVRWMNSSLPGIRIDQEGQVAGFTDWKDSVGTTLQFMRNTGATDKQVREMDMMLSQPGFDTGLQQSLVQSWHAWVGALAGQTLPLGEELSTQQTQQIPGVGDIPLKQRVLARAVEIEGKPRRVSVVIASQMAPEHLKRMLAATGQLDRGVEPVDAVDTIEGVYEIETMRPIRVRRSSQFRWRVQGEVVDQLEAHDYVFHWTDL